MIRLLCHSCRQSIIFYFQRSSSSIPTAVAWCLSVLLLSNCNLVKHISALMSFATLLFFFFDLFHEILDSSLWFCAHLLHWHSKLTLLLLCDNVTISIVFIIFFELLWNLRKCTGPPILADEVRLTACEIFSISFCFARLRKGQNVFLSALLVVVPVDVLHRACKSFGTST